MVFKSLKRSEGRSVPWEVIVCPMEDGTSKVYCGPSMFFRVDGVCTFTPKYRDRAGKDVSAVDGAAWGDVHISFLDVCDFDDMDQQDLIVLRDVMARLLPGATVIGYPPTVAA